jgi:putative nucleotidyltransferase with HDIG domain
LQDLALATSVIRLFGSMPENLVTMESFWRHSVACGVTARAIAARRREANVERYFVAGLLHDIGRPIMYMQVPEESRTAVLRSRETGEPLFRVEHSLLGFDHCHVGHALLDLWKLPQSLRESVANHHHPDRSQRFPIETAVVHVADLIANALGLGSSGEPGVPPLDVGAWECIGLPPTSIEDILDDAERHYEAAVEVIALDPA